MLGEEMRAGFWARIIAKMRTEMPDSVRTLISRSLSRVLASARARWAIICRR